MLKPLSGRVAVVAGATRGAGRGIAPQCWGAGGATVYCTGRSSRARPNLSNHVNAGRPETIEETAEMVTADGGTGIPVRIDHNDDHQVAGLFDRVHREQNRLDALAIVMTGQPASWKVFVDESPTAGRQFIESWIWPHISTAWHGGEANGAVSIRADRRVGRTGERRVSRCVLLRHDGDTAETACLRPSKRPGKDGVTAVAVGPGFMRTEAILEGFGVNETNWRGALRNPQAIALGWGGSETPCFVGRAVAVLAADPNVARKRRHPYRAGVVGGIRIHRRGWHAA